MKKITSTAELKNAIVLLEEKKALQGRLLKEQYHLACEGLKPGNLAKNLFSRFSSSTDFKIGITAAAVSLTAFYFAKRAIVRSTQHPFKRLFGSLLRAGVSNLVSRHPEEIRSIGQVVLHRLLNKRSNPEKA